VVPTLASEVLSPVSPDLAQALDLSTPMSPSSEGESTPESTGTPGYGEPLGERPSSGSSEVLVADSQVGVVSDVGVYPTPGAPATSGQAEGGDGSTQPTDVTSTTPETAVTTTVVSGLDPVGGQPPDSEQSVFGQDPEGLTISDVTLTPTTAPTFGPGDTGVLVQHESGVDVSADTTTAGSGVGGSGTAQALLDSEGQPLEVTYEPQPRTTDVPIAPTTDEQRATASQVGLRPVVPSEDVPGRTQIGVFGDATSQGGLTYVAEPGGDTQAQYSVATVGADGLLRLGATADMQGTENAIDDGRPLAAGGVGLFASLGDRPDTPGVGVDGTVRLGTDAFGNASTTLGVEPRVQFGGETPEDARLVVTGENLVGRTDDLDSGASVQSPETIGITGILPSGQYLSLGVPVGRGRVEQADGRAADVDGGFTVQLGYNSAYPAARDDYAAAQRERMLLPELDPSGAARPAYGGFTESSPGATATAETQSVAAESGQLADLLRSAGIDPPWWAAGTDDRLGDIIGDGPTGSAGGLRAGRPGETLLADGGLMSATTDAGILPVTGGDPDGDAGGDGAAGGGGALFAQRPYPAVERNTGAPVPMDPRQENIITDPPRPRYPAVRQAPLDGAFDPIEYSPFYHPNLPDWAQEVLRQSQSWSPTFGTHLGVAERIPGYTESINSNILAQVLNRYGYDALGLGNAGQQNDRELAERRRGQADEETEVNLERNAARHALTQRSADLQQALGLQNTGTQANIIRNGAFHNAVANADASLDRTISDMRNESGVAGESSQTELFLQQAIETFDREARDPQSPYRDRARQAITDIRTLQSQSLSRQQVVDALRSTYRDVLSTPAQQRDEDILAREPRVDLENRLTQVPAPVLEPDQQARVQRAVDAAEETLEQVRNTPRAPGLATDDLYNGTLELRPLPQPLPTVTPEEISQVTSDYARGVRSSAIVDHIVRSAMAPFPLFGSLQWAPSDRAAVNELANDVTEHFSTINERDRQRRTTVDQQFQSNNLLFNGLMQNVRLAEIEGRNRQANNQALLDQADRQAEEAFRNDIARAQEALQRGQAITRRTVEFNERLNDASIARAGQLQVLQQQNADARHRQANLARMLPFVDPDIAADAEAILSATQRAQIPPIAVEPTVREVLERHEEGLFRRLATGTPPLDIRTLDHQTGRDVTDPGSFVLPAGPFDPFRYDRDRQYVRGIPPEEVAARVEALNRANGVELGDPGYVYVPQKDIEAAQQHRREQERRGVIFMPSPPPSAPAAPTQPSRPPGMPPGY
jgi:hypothetical protein